MCMIDYADERVIVRKQESRRASKSHWCDECGREILPSEAYLYESYLWEGKYQQHKTCAHCQVVRDWLSLECGGFLYGACEEDIAEHGWENYYGVGVKMLAVGMRRKWRKRDGSMWRVPSIPRSPKRIAQEEGGEQGQAHRGG